MAKPAPASSQHIRGRPPVLKAVTLSCRMKSSNNEVQPQIVDTRNVSPSKQSQPVTFTDQTLLLLPELKLEFGRAAVWGRETKTWAEFRNFLELVPQEFTAFFERSMGFSGKIQTNIQGEGKQEAQRAVKSEPSLYATQVTSASHLQPKPMSGKDQSLLLALAWKKPCQEPGHVLQEEDTILYRRL